MMERESVGIKGIDSMLDGGLPQSGIFGLSGPPGVGKSIFCLHYLLAGARKGQKCVYINLEEPIENIYRMIEQFEFGNEFKKYLKTNRVVLKCYTYSEFEKIQGELLKKIKEENDTERLVLDSFNGFFNYIYMPETNVGGINARRTINQVFSNMRRENLTTVLTIEKDTNCPGLNYNLPFLVDGMIQFDFLDIGTIERRVFIKKMRWTNQSRDSKDFDINYKGISVLEE
ncbi:MAG: RAD55 family ATPase [Bacteroidota bacterium]